MAQVMFPLLRRILLVAVLFSIVFSGSAFRSFATVTWSSPTQVPVNTTFNTGPSVTQDNQGRLWLVYQSNPLLAMPKIYYKIFNGFAWTSEQLVTSDPHKNISPTTLALSNGTIMVAWTSNRTGSSAIFYKTNTAGVFSDERQITFNSTAVDSDPNLAQESSGKIWVVWQRAHGSTADIFYRTIQGSTLNPEVRLTTDPSANILPSITVGLDGKVWIAWASLRTGNYEIFYTIITGPSRTPDTPLTKDATVDQNPDVVQARDGSTYIIWSKEIKIGTNQFESDLYYEVTTDNGATWSAQAALTSTTLFDDFAPSAIQSTDTRLWLFWSSDMPSGSDFNIFYIFSSQILVHNVDVNAFSTNPLNSPKGSIKTLNATVSDTGDFPETAKLVFTANATIVGSINVTLSQGQIMNVVLPWNTSSFKPGCYLMTASLTVPGETLILQADNSMTARTHVLYVGDLNKDGIVNIIDVAILANSYGTTPSSPLWNPNADLNHDGIINIIDLSIVGANYGKSIPMC